MFPGRRTGPRYCQLLPSGVGRGGACPSRRPTGCQVPLWGRWEGDSLQLMGAGSLPPLPLPKGDQGFSPTSPGGGLESCLPNGGVWGGREAPQSAQAEGAALGARGWEPGVPTGWGSGVREPGLWLTIALHGQV